MTPDTRHQGSAELALRRHKRDGTWLLKTAHAIAHAHQKKTASTLGDRHDDLVQYLVEIGCRYAIRYEAERSGPDYTFDSYLWDIMERRVPDFYRRKSEGFGDRRHGNDQRMILHRFDADIDEPVDPHLDFDALLSERRVARWNRASRKAGLDLNEWIAQTLDQAANVLEEAA